uniref:Uncharacterized protein n=1 Tax=Ananas comosus var. bracteatus TaxID=296719 RepID=A0A6V7NPF5_ANACO|nr:unnamed protein product [Ananas comosus var. bracteatus]
MNGVRYEPEANFTSWLLRKTELLFTLSETWRSLCGAHPTKLLFLKPNTVRPPPPLLFLFSFPIRRYAFSYATPFPSRLFLLLLFLPTTQPPNPSFARAPSSPSSAITPSPSFPPSTLPLRIAVDHGHGHGHDLQEEPGPHGGLGSEKQEVLPPWISRWTPRLGWRSRASSRSKAGMEIESFKSKRNGIRVTCTRFHTAITNDYSLIQIPCMHLHESIYCQMCSLNYFFLGLVQIATIRGEFESFFDPIKATKDGRPVYFTGEMVFLWMFEEIHALRHFKEAAIYWLKKNDWPPLYDVNRLNNNQVHILSRREPDPFGRFESVK